MFIITVIEIIVISVVRVYSELSQIWLRRHSLFDLLLLLLLLRRQEGNVPVPIFSEVIRHCGHRDRVQHNILCIAHIITSLCIFPLALLRNAFTCCSCSQ